MALAHIHFRPRRGADVDTLAMYAFWHASALWGNGSIDNDPILEFVSNGVLVAATFHGVGAMKPARYISYAKQHLEAAASLCRNEPRWKPAGPAPLRDTLPSWRRAAMLIVSVPYSSTNLVVRDNAYRTIPTWTLPLTDDQRDSLSRWGAKIDAFRSIWLQSGELEHAAYRVVVDPRSKVNRWGRDLAALIEHVTRKPTYLELDRYYAHREGELDRPCPGCGRAWARRRVVHCDIDLRFRCDRCRLVSFTGNTSDEPARLARIGEWTKTAKPVAAARTLFPRINRTIDGEVLP